MHTNVRRQLSVTTATFFFFIFAFCIPTLQINTFALVFSKVSAACVMATISHFSLHTHTHAHFSLNALTASDFGCAILFFICVFFFVFAFLLLHLSQFLCTFCVHIARKILNYHAVKCIYQLLSAFCAPLYLCSPARKQFGWQARG